MEPQVNLKSWERRIPLGLIRRHNLSRTAVPGNVVLCAWTTLNSNLNFIAGDAKMTSLLLVLVRTHENSRSKKLESFYRTKWTGPAENLDLSLIKNHFQMNYGRDWEPTSVRDLTNALLEEWSRIPQWTHSQTWRTSFPEVVLTVNCGLTSHSTLFIRNGVSHTHTFVIVVLKAALYFWTCNSENIFSKGPQKYVGHTERQPLRAW